MVKQKIDFSTRKYENVVMKKIALRNSDELAIVSDCDLDKCVKIPWLMSNCGYAVGVLRKGPGSMVSMHRYILKPPKGMVVDHINGNKLDNRRSNLRAVSQSQNLHYRNKPNAGSAVPYIGVSLENGAYRASCCINGERVHLGQYSTAEEARDIVRHYKYTHGVLPPEDTPNDWSWIDDIKPLVRPRQGKKERIRPLTDAEIHYVKTYKDSGMPMYKYYQAVVEDLPMQAASRRANRLIDSVNRYGLPAETL